MSREIERKFLVKELPENLNIYTAEKILQGYLNITNKDLEVRFRKRGDSYFQTIKQGNGLNREEVEVQISKEQFVTFWPLTEHRRIIKRRYKIPYQSHLIELDIYEDKYNGMVACEVEFDNEDEAMKFVPPEWVCEEITNEFTLQNNRVALEGIPKELLKKYKINLKEENIYLQSGVIPIRNEQEVLIITNRKKNWIFPKGIIEHDLTSEDSAKKEAYEEAGILGDVTEKFGDYKDEKWNGVCHIEMFIFENVKELDQWPENFRKRKWVKIKKLSEYIKKQELQPIVKKLKKQIHQMRILCQN